MKNYISEKFTHMVHGGDYNPDQWKDEPQIIEEDFKLMEKSVCNTMSIGIFAWTLYEPSEGNFDFSFMDKIMDKLAENGKFAILATPSGARPAWMAEKYPEVLRVNEDGRRIKFSQRHNHCYTSTIYREKVKKINTLLAQRYKDHPALMGWHLSNEYGGRCYCDLCVKEFRNWLKKKYDNDIEKLNKQYWSYFWSHQYTSFDQIDAPDKTYGIGDSCLMGLVLDWYRFSDDQARDFMEEEYKTVKEITPGIPVTTNLMGDYHVYNYKKWADILDFVSWDSYPAWHLSDDTEMAIRTAMLHNIMRSLKPDKPFFLMESTPSLVNWNTVNKTKRPGMHMLSSLQAIAHGSDSVQYFQWRKGRGGAEKFHGAVVDHDGTENTRTFRDVTDVGNALKKLDGVCGTLVKSDAAIIYDWDAITAFEAYIGYNNKKRNYFGVMHSAYRPFWKNGINTDFVDMDSPFENYKLIVFPQLYAIKEENISKIADFVRNGGTAIMTYSSAMVNENDLCYLGGFPAEELKDVFGVWAEEVDCFTDQANSATYKEKSYDGEDICEIIHARGSEILATYDKDFYKGSPAVTVNSYGRGKAYYVAMRDKEGLLLNDLISDIIKESNLSGAVESKLPEGVTANIRENYIFIQNFSTEEKTVENVRGFDVINEKEIDGNISLLGYETAVIRK